MSERFCDDSLVKQLIINLRRLFILTENNDNENIIFPLELAANFSLVRQFRAVKMFVTKAVCTVCHTDIFIFVI